ncbi:MAG: hypothetical protein ACON38_18435 [Akkermansiaceae bacterium]
MNLRIPSIPAASFLFAGFLPAEEWKLVWSDEFNGSGHPSPEK